MVFDNIFYEIAALLLVAAAAGALAVWLRQPLLVAFIAVGLLVGPAGLGWVTAKDQIDLLAQLGIALLLFVVGLKLDLHIIRTMGAVALATGLGQVAFTSVIGFLICIALGLDLIASVYVAVALTFSSTIIIVKLLSDKREIDSLHGRIAVGFLIVQDIVAVIALIALTAFGAETGAESLGDEIAAVLFRGGAFVLAIVITMRLVFPRLLPLLAKSQELLVLFAIAWAAALASGSAALGFSKEVGAFLAGVSLASTAFREAIATRLTSLRDFLLLFFFIDLGAKMDLSLLGDQLGASLLLSAFVLVGNPLIVMVIMGTMGYTKRTGFLAGLTVAQISEFSLILGALGLSLGHIRPEDMGLITLVGLITISGSTYMILYSHLLYDRLARWLGPFERRFPHREQADAEAVAGGGTDVILFGLGRFGAGIALGLRERGVRVLGVDFDPSSVRSWNARNHRAVYGDAEDPEFPATLPLAEARWVISTASQIDVNLALLHSLRHHGYAGEIALTAHSAHDAMRYREAGASHVLLPFADAARKAVDQVVRSLEPGAGGGMGSLDGVGAGQATRGQGG